MQNKKNWMPSKFEYYRGQWRASHNTKQVAIGSRLVANITADWYSKNLTHHATGRLLDLGCGRVPFFGMYQIYVSENTCLDWSDSFHENSYLDIEHDLTQALPFSNEEFDTIILSDVLEHIPEPFKLFQEMHRVLKKDGKIIMNVPFFYCLHECPHDYYRYTEFALRRFATQAELGIVQLESSGGSIEVFTDIIAKHLQFIPLAGKFFSILFQNIAYSFGKTKFGKKIREKTAKAFPFGYFIVLIK